MGCSKWEAKASIYRLEQGQAQPCHLLVPSPLSDSRPFFVQAVEICLGARACHGWHGRACPVVPTRPEHVAFLSVFEASAFCF